MTNQDAWKKGDSAPFFLLADGVGGQPAGALAASELVSSLATELEALWPALEQHHERKEVLQTLESLVHKSNLHLLELGRQNNALIGMASTLSALFFIGAEGFFTNIGDSRIYRLRKHRLELLTRDDSLLFELVHFGLLSEKEAKTFPLRHVITKSLGSSPVLDISWQTIPLANEDLFLLCCDGLSGFVTDKKIQEILNKNKPLAILSQELVDEAIRSGSKDNVTSLLIKILSL